MKESIWLLDFQDRPDILLEMRISDVAKRLIWEISVRGNLAMWKRLLIVLLILYLGAVANCNNAEGRTPKRDYNIPPTSCRGACVRPDVLKEASFAGTVKTADIEVLYQKDLESQADYVATQINKMLSYIQKSTGFQMAFNKIRVYLLWADRIPLPPQTVRTMFIESDNNLQMILFVEHGDESFESIITRNYSYPYNFIHELVEVSISYPKKGPPVLNDYRRGIWPFRGRVLNYTRWFREGFSSYAGYLAYEVITSDTNFNKRHIRAQSIQNGLHLQPFSALSKIGKELFTWHQFTKYPTDLRHSPNLPNPKKVIIDYYDAAFGLFLVIRDRFGEDAIQEIVNGIGTIEKVNGPALIDLANKTLNTDIEELVENFHFPNTGLYMDPVFPGKMTPIGKMSTEGLLVTVVEPNSPAAQAGIKKGDVVHRINGANVRTNLDFELKIFELMQKQTIKVDLWKEEDGNISIELELRG